VEDGEGRGRGGSIEVVGLWIGGGGDKGGWTGNGANTSCILRKGGTKHVQCRKSTPVEAGVRLS